MSAKLRRASLATWMAGAVVMNLAAEAAAETPLERGTYLMESIVACGNCHTPQGPDGPIPGMELAGGLPMTDPAFFAYSANITPDPETGIGAWTDDQIVDAIRNGKRPDGSTIGPPMPFSQYRNMSDGDARAIVAYLRNVAPVKNAVPDSRYAFPLPPAYGPPVASVPEPDRNDKVAYGAYLAGPAGHCMECHTPFGGAGFDYANRLGAGGQEISGPWGISVSANITPDAETGIGGWSDDEIKNAIRHGVKPDGSHLAPPMAFAYYANMAEDDLDAIVAYLRSLKPIRAAVK